MPTLEERIRSVEDKLQDYRTVVLTGAAVAIPFLMWITFVDAPNKITAAVATEFNRMLSTEAGKAVRDQAQELQKNLEASKSLVGDLGRAFTLTVQRSELEAGSKQSGCDVPNPVHLMACARYYCINKSTRDRKFVGGALQEVNATTKGITIVCLVGDEFK